MRPEVRKHKFYMLACKKMASGFLREACRLCFVAGTVGRATHREPTALPCAVCRAARIHVGKRKVALVATTWVAVPGCAELAKGSRRSERCAHAASIDYNVWQSRRDAVSVWDSGKSRKAFAKTVAGFSHCQAGPLTHTHSRAKGTH